MPTVEEQLAEVNARIQQLQAKQASDRLENTTIGDRLSRSVDSLQASGGASVQALGEILGIDSLARSGEEIKTANLAEAERAAPEPRSIFSGDDKLGGLGDIVLESSVPMAAILGSTGAGAATGSLFGPAGTLIGGALGLGLASFGMNLGDIKLIEESIDPDSVSNLTTAGFAGAATVPDLLTGGFLTAVGKSAKEVVKQGTKTAIAKEIAKDTTIGAATGTAAAASSAGLVVGGALASTDTPINWEAVDAYSETVGNAAILGLGFSSFAAGGQSLRAASRAKSDLKADERSLIQFDEDDKAYYREPNTLAGPESGIFSDKMGTLKMGRAVDQVAATSPENITVRDFTRNYDATFTERSRRIEKPTINTEAQLRKSDYLEQADQFGLSKLSRKEGDQIKQDLFAGKDTPWTQKLKAVFKAIRDEAVAVGMKVGDLGATYFPWHPDIKKIKDNRAEFEAEMVQALSASRDVESATNMVRSYTDDLLAAGGLTLGDAVRAPRWLEDAISAAAEGNTEALKKPLVSSQKQGSVNKRNNLEMHRKLSEVSPEILDKWAKDLDILDAVEQYIQLATERIAFARRFGAEGEGVHLAVRTAALEGVETGRPLPYQAIQKMYDLSNLQQRITNKRVTPEQRRNTNLVRSTLNYLLLPFATVASLAEPLFLAPKVGAKSFVKGGVKTMEAMGRKIIRKVLKNIPRSEQEEVVAGLNSSYREALRTTAARIGEDVIDPNKMDSFLFKWNGLAAWTEFTRQWAQISAIDSMGKLAQVANDPSYSKAQRRDAGLKLAEAGLDVAKVQEWVDAGKPKVGNPEQPWDIGHYYNNIRAGAIDVAEDVIFRPTPVNKPMWASDPTFGFQMFSHLKTFPLQFNNRIALPVAQRIAKETGRPLVDAAKTVILATVAGLGFSLIDQLNSFVKTGSTEAYEDRSDKEKVVGALARYGGLGIFVDPLHSKTFGGTALEAVGGPFISKVSGGVGNVGDVILGDKEPETLVDDIVRSLPNIAGSREAILEGLE